MTTVSYLIDLAENQPDADDMAKTGYLLPLFSTLLQYLAGPKNVMQVLRRIFLPVSLSC